MIVVVSGEVGEGDPRRAEGHKPTNVLFVCTANICRSAFAQVLASHMAGPGADVTFASAGTYGLPAHPMDPQMAALLPAGADHSGFASRRVTRGLIEDADLVLAAAGSHRRFVLDEYPTSVRTVFTLGQFAEAAQDSQLAGRALVAEVWRRRPPVRPEHDIQDPYRRGAAASAKAAARITNMLETVVPALLGRS